MSTERTSARATLGEKLVEATAPPISRPGTERKATRLRIRTPANRFGDEGELIPPPGMTYEWKVRTVLGQENKEAMTNWKLNGWTPVPAGRHPEYTNESPDSQASIERGGQILCERPEELTEESKRMEKKVADDQVNSQLERLALRARQTESQRVTKLKRTVEAITDEV